MIFHSKKETVYHYSQETGSNTSILSSLETFLNRNLLRQYHFPRKSHFMMKQFCILWRVISQVWFEWKWHERNTWDVVNIEDKFDAKNIKKEASIDDICLPVYCYLIYDAVLSKQRLYVHLLYSTHHGFPEPLWCVCFSTACEQWASVDVCFCWKSEGDSWFLLLLSAVFQQLPRAVSSINRTVLCCLFI